MLYFVAMYSIMLIVKLRAWIVIISWSSLQMKGHLTWFGENSRNKYTA